METGLAATGANLAARKRVGMNHNMIETVLGGVVLAVAAVFVVFAYTNASLGTTSGYELTARFDRVGELRQGDDVKLAGIKVGSVTGQRLDPETFQAVITMTVEPQIKIPADTVAEVASAGLMGGNYVLLTPGASDRELKPGEEIAHTQSAISLVDLIGKAMFSSKGGPEGSPGPASDPLAPQELPGPEGR